MKPDFGPSSSDDRLLAALTWGLGIFVSFLAPLIIYFVAKDRPFVRKHSAMALAATLFFFLAGCVAGVLAIILVGFLLFPVIAVLHVLCGIMGVIAASSGQGYRPPVIEGLARSMFGV